jgi:hypothetical protein
MLGAIAATAAPLPAVAARPPVQTPEARLQAAIEELKAAAAAAFPELDHWRICLDAQKECPLLVAAFKPIKS